MSLRYTTFMITGLATTALFAVLYILSNTIVLNGFVELEKQFVEKNAKRAVAAIDQENAQMVNVLLDWSNWDETYTFLEGNNPAYIEENIIDTTLTNLHLNVMVLINREHAVVVKKTLDLTDQQERALSQSLARHLVDGDRLIPASDDAKPLKGIFSFSEGVMLIASSPVLRNEGKGPRTGTLIMGRLINDSMAQKIAETTFLAVEIFSLRDRNLPPDFKNIRPWLSEDHPITINALDEETIAGYTLLHDIYGQPTLFLKITMPRTIYQEGQKTLSYMIYSLLMVIFIFWLIQRLILGNLVLNRLSKLSTSVTDIAHRGNFSLRLPLEQTKTFQNDELGNLMKNINQMLEALEQNSAKLVQLKEEAEVANRAKSAFFASMTHELRTPLTVILGYSQMLKRLPGIRPSAFEFIDIINRNGEHLLTLVNNVLDMSKIEAGRVVINEEPFDLYHMIDDIDKMFRLRVSESHVSLICEYTPDTPRYVQADQTKVRQVVINLISNAVKFTKEGMIKLSVSCEKDPERNRTEDSQEPSPLILRFTVEDTGDGIAPEEMDTLFQPFVQTKSGLQSKQGTGLGLSLSEKFVRLMGGTMTVQSEVNRGTTFTFTIRAKSVDLRTTPLDSEEHHVIGIESPQTPYRILVVDDRESNLKLLSHLINFPGIEIGEASNGQQAIEQFEKWDPNFIFMNLLMPVLDGYEATKHIKSTKRGQTIPIIAVTANAFDDGQTEALSAGCDGYILKPFQKEEIYAALTKHLGVQFIYECPTK